MAGRIKAAINRAIPGVLFGSVLIPAGLSAGVGILVLVFWRGGGDIALGVVAIALGVAVLTGTIISLALLRRQNRMVRAQAELVAHVGHELRTPLASIMMGIETLKSDRLSSAAERAAFLDMMERESNRLAALVEKAIGYQVAAGRRRTRADDATARTGALPIPAGRAVADAVSTWLTRPDTASLVRFVDRCARTDLLAVDADALAGAIGNLVDNALTHGRVDATNPLLVRLDAEGLHGAQANGRPRTGRDGWIVLTVQDHGPGIPRPDRKRVFDRFQRGAAATGNETPGLGLGLSIVRQFALGAGGSIDYDETPGGGATFTLRLPRVDGRGVPAGRGPGCTPDGNDEPGTDGEPAGSRTPGENRDA